MANLFEQDRNYILGDPELEIIGDRGKLAQWRHKGMGPAYYKLGRKITAALGTREEPRLSGIGISGTISCGPNERRLYAWQKHAGQFSEKTIDRHLTAIRWLESFLDGKPFAKLTLDDCYAVRDHLKASLQPGAADPKAA